MEYFQSSSDQVYLPGCPPLTSFYLALHNNNVFSVTTESSNLDLWMKQDIPCYVFDSSWMCGSASKGAPKIRSWVLYWVYTDPYSFIYWAIRENIPQLPDQYGESTLPILSYQEGHTGKITFKHWECLYYDSSRDVRWNLAWALGKSLGLRPQDFPHAQAIFHGISLLSS